MARNSPPPDDPSSQIFRSEEELAQLSASERIRYRLVSAERRYHANDNISAFVRAGEVEELTAEVQAQMQEVLRALVIVTPLVAAVGSYYDYTRQMYLSIPLYWVSYAVLLVVAFWRRVPYGGASVPIC